LQFLSFESSSQLATWLVALSKFACYQPRRFVKGAVEMSALTLRLPDDKHQRLRALAKSRGTTVNRLVDEMTTLMLAEFDAETHFRLRAMRGADNVERGLALLDNVAT
jgi:predicted transcriptional regulator